MRKKLFSVILASALAISTLAGCGAKDEASVYYLNFKPEQDTQWQELAKKYTEETGIPVTVVTAASGTYETTLQAEIEKSDAPTLFQVNGPVGLANWEDYCYDLSGSAVYGELTSDSYALKKNDAALAVAYTIESYGLIVNKTLLAKAGYELADIDSFADLKAVAEDITARSAELGFAAFTSTGMDSSSDWRFKTHLANLPLYFEYKADGVIDCSLKFCGLYDIEKKSVSEALKKEGIPVLSLETDYEDSDAGQLRTRIEAFVEMLFSVFSSPFCS